MSKMTSRDAVNLSKKYADRLPLLEVHMLHTSSCSLMNRDFNNRQKVITYGGVERARFSSQSVLHDIRFKAEDEYNVHTRMLPLMLKNLLKEWADENEVDEKALKTAYKIVDSCFAKDAKDATNVTEIFKSKQVIDVDQYTLEEYAAAVKTAVGMMLDKENADVTNPTQASKKVAEILATTSATRSLSDVTALFGRMATDSTFSTVYSPLLVSHAFSVDAYENDFDDRTATDDYSALTGIKLKDDDGNDKQTGAGFMDTRDISSNTYYRYMAIEQVKLFENLCIGKPNDEESIEKSIEKTYELSARMVREFCKALPSANKTRMQTMTEPDVVYIQKGRPMAVTAANYFEKPVKKTDDLSPRDMAVERLKAFANNSVHGCFADYDIQGQYWLSNMYPAPDNMEKATYHDFEEIVKPVAKPSEV